MLQRMDSIKFASHLFLTTKSLCQIIKYTQNKTRWITTNAQKQLRYSWDVFFFFPLALRLMRLTKTLLPEKSRMLFGLTLAEEYLEYLMYHHDIKGLPSQQCSPDSQQLHLFTIYCNWLIYKHEDIQTLRHRFIGPLWREITSDSPSVTSRFQGQ